METIINTLDDVIAASDMAGYAKEYQKHDMLVIPDFLPREQVNQHLRPEVDRCTSYINRVYVPGFKKSGSVSYENLEQHAPQLYSVYNLPAMKTFIENIVGEKLFLCPKSDQHAAALYYYTEQGDHIATHYDKSFYKGRRYTVLLGVVQDSEHSNLVCYPGKDKKNPLTVATHPGTLVMFNGNVLWHKVSALAERERRVILTMEFVSDVRMSRLNKFISNTKDRFLYFGKSQRQEA